MHDILFSSDLFGLLPSAWPVHVYGVLVALGFMLAMSVAWRHGHKEGEDPEQVVDLCYWILVAGLLGARAVFIMTKLDDYLAHPAEVVKFWRGGLVWYGGFLAAVACAWAYTRRHKMNFFKQVDLLIAPMCLAHTFGRLGCLSAGCCFGRPSELPWAVVFPVGSMVQQAQLTDRLVQLGQMSLPVHPTQLYEAGVELALFWLLLWMRPRKRFHGQLFLTWLSLYPIARSVIEMFRGDKERGVFILSTSQYISIGVGLAAAVLALYFLRQQRRAGRGQRPQAMAMSGR